MYELDFTDDAVDDLEWLDKHDAVSSRKALKLIDELRIDPYKGTGHPEQLKGHNGVRWSRRVSKKHRLVYEIIETQILVLILAARGHYNDK